MQSLLRRYDKAIANFQFILVPLFLFICRLWVAWVFFKSGYIKVTSWDTTLFLFELEYQVPLLPWLWAAYLGTAAELILPPLLLIGLFTRASAIALSGVNIIAVISYPVIWEAGFLDHKLWGVMLFTLVLWGGGYLSADRLIRTRINHTDDGSMIR